MIEPLVRGICPICNKVIMNEKNTIFINDGMDFFVKLDDKNRASFACCQECFDKITQEQLNMILERQKVNWLKEIQAQLDWFAREVLNYKIIKYARNKEEL